MSDAESSSMKVEHTEKLAIAWMKLLEGKNVNAEIRWKVGHPVYINFGEGHYQREVLLYPKYDTLVFQAILEGL